MKTRLNYSDASPGAYQAMLGLEKFIRSCGLEHGLLNLVKLRASQVNGCAFCIDMHWKDARAAGETEQRLYGLDAWEESPYYTPRERAALAWTETLTLVSETHAPDDVYAEVSKEFKPDELINLTLAIVTINGWNRLAIGFRTEPGTYQPPTARRQA